MTGELNQIRMTFTDIVLEKTSYAKTPHRRVRPYQGRKVLKMCLEAMNEGHKVTMETRYDKNGTELMSGEIIYDGKSDECEGV